MRRNRVTAPTDLMSELDSDEDDKKLSTQSTNCCELIHGCDTRA